MGTRCKRVEEGSDSPRPLHASALTESGSRLLSGSQRVRLTPEALDNRKRRWYGPVVADSRVGWGPWARWAAILGKTDCLFCTADATCCANAHDAGRSANIRSCDAEACKKRAEALALFFIYGEEVDVAAAVAPVCQTCGAPAFCVGWPYPWNGDASKDSFFCAEHCDHDCCCTVEERFIADRSKAPTLRSPS